METNQPSDPTTQSSKTGWIILGVLLCVAILAYVGFGIFSNNIRDKVGGAADALGGSFDEVPSLVDPSETPAP